MSIFPPTTPTGFVGATQAALNSNEASVSNPFITENDLASSLGGLPLIVLIAPNGSKWKVTVGNTGALTTTAL